MNAFTNFKNTYEGLPKAFYSKVKLSPVRNPRLLLLNHELADELGLPLELLESEEGIQVLSGNRPINGEYGLSQAYAGHQFGHFTMLGDGRAVMIGEQLTPSGELYDLQLKGSGRTPYSRRGDGRATLPAMLREYLISEGMNGLGIPTSRSLAVVETGERVLREKDFQGAILTRVAKSHLRIGTFQYGAALGSEEELKSLADYAILRHYKECMEEKNPYWCLLEKVVTRQAKLIAAWQSKGFIHGVMNTDNMTISGETIDYGPCAFMDEYSENTVFSSIDNYGRYAYGNQPKMGIWNLTRLAEALLPLLHEDRERSIYLAEGVLSSYDRVYRDTWLAEMAGKIGLDKPDEKHRSLIQKLFALMEKESLDFTNTFLGLMEDLMVEQGLLLERVHTFKEDSEIQGWKPAWKDLLQNSGRASSDIIQTMKSRNPRFIPRNHLVEEALKKYSENGDDTAFKELLSRVMDPYRHGRGLNEKDLKYQQPGPKDGKPYKTYCGT